ncbi:MAG: PPC domain-containing protein [Anaerolineae bacterium]|nr:PPC domain-containing protein [Anaerolineae bacterium]
MNRFVRYRFVRYRFAPGLLLIAALLCPVGLVQAQQGWELHYNSAVHNTLTESQPEHRWTFTGDAGDRILIDMRADNPDMLDTYLTLLDPTGGTLLTDDDGGEGFNSRIGPYQLPADGQYTILAARYSGVGAYALEVRSLDALPTLRSGKPLVGVVNAEHVSDFFLLEAVPEMPLMQVVLRTDLSADNMVLAPSLAVYGADGLIATTEAQDPPTGIIDPVALLPGEAYFVVVNWNANGAGGPYEIDLIPSEVELLESGIVQQATLDYNTVTQQHFFWAEADQDVRVMLQTHDSLALTTEIYSLDQQVWLFNNGGLSVHELSVRLTIPANGLYVIAVHDGSFSGESGTYTILVEPVAE